MTTGTDPKAVGERATKALGWSMLNTAVSRFGTIAVGVALARVLGPDAFGTFAIATVALLAMLSFNELGVSLAIVRWKGDPREIVSTVNTISLVMSLLLFGVVWLCAPSFSAAMGDPSAAPVVRLMAVSIVINGLVASPAALLQRNFQQRRRMVVDQTNTWLGAAVSLALAFFGFGAMSLAIGRVVGSAAAAILFIAWSPLPYRIGFRWDTAKKLMAFGVPLAGASIIVFSVGFADQLVVGSALGATALGFYVLAFNLSSWPVSLLSQPLRSVAPAAFSRLQDHPERMRQTFVAVFGVMFAIVVPSCVFLSATSGPIVEFIYGPPWAPSASILVWLGLTAISRIFFELSYDFLVVKSATRGILVVQIIWLAALPGALIAGAQLFGVPGVAAAQLAVTTVIVTPAYAILLRRVGISPRALMSEAMPSLGVGAVLTLALVGVPLLGFSALLTCLLSGVLTTAAIALLLRLKRASLSALRRTSGVSPGDDALVSPHEGAIGSRADERTASPRQG